MYVRSDRSLNRLRFEKKSAWDFFCICLIVHVFSMDFLSLRFEKKTITSPKTKNR